PLTRFTSQALRRCPRLLFIMPERLLAHALKHSSHQPRPHFLCSHTLRIQNVLAFGYFLLRYDHNKGKSDCCFAVERQPKIRLAIVFCSPTDGEIQTTIGREWLDLILILRLHSCRVALLCLWRISTYLPLA